MTAERAHLYRLAQAAKGLDKARTKRDRLIVEAVADGVAARAVGRAVGMSHVAVAKLVARSPDAERNDLRRR
jgi:F0F1-type ATP synthase membrane subunit c/vacuolar-type H+-ATPase subunit K